MSQVVICADLNVTGSYVMSEMSQVAKKRVHRIVDGSYVLIYMSEVAMC